MKRWLRSIWIGLLSGTATLASCSLFSPPPCYYGPPPVDSLKEVPQSARRQALQQRLSAIQDILEERQNAEVYGSPEIMEEYAKETMRLRAEADSLRNELENLDLE